jgi:preprotein translocase subunit SecG
MSSLLLGTLVGSLLGWLMGFLSVFLVLLVLIQRGKGGGLTGALGGPGGQSAFGSKAGDTFTVITIVVASVWGFTCAFTMWLLGTHSSEPVAKANMQAGPGDFDPETESMPLDFPMGDVPAGAGSGIGGDGETGTTESMDLIPANRSTDQPSDTSADEATSTEEATDTVSPAADASEPAAGDTSESPETPSPETSADAAPADESDESE